MPRLILFIAASLLAAACLNLAPGSTTAPSRLPTAPPVSQPSPSALPSIAVPSIAIPSIAIPSIAIPSIAIPSIAIPSVSVPSIDIPVPTAVPGGGMCRLISAEEVADVMGTPVTQTEATDVACAYFSTTNFSTVTLRTESTDLETAKMFLDNPRDLTVANHQAVVGNFMGPILYIARGPVSLVIQAVVLGDEGITEDQLIQIGTIAVGRW